MAYPSSSTSRCSLCFLALPLFILYLPTTLSQDTGVSGSTQGSCRVQILSLLPCMAFVQGREPAPPESCCDSLNQIYREQPQCLCLLLNSSEFDSLPINSTLALELPVTCHLQAEVSDCSRVLLSPPISASPTSQVSFGAKNNSTIGEKNNSTVASSPMVQIAPRPRIINGGNFHNRGTKLVVKSESIFVEVGLAALLVAETYFQG